MSILILRPEPGGSATALRARALGLEAVTAPLFTLRPLAWDPPDPSGFDALLLTSANAARHAGPALDRFVALPCFAVGESTAAAARAAGFARVVDGPADGAALARAAAHAGIGRALHLHGRDHLALPGASIRIEGRAVYAADPVTALPEIAIRALAAGAIALLHSPRSAALFASLAPRRARVRIAAISEPTALAAGPGWGQIAVAPAPRDSALLELAAKLCNIAETDIVGRDGANGL